MENYSHVQQPDLRYQYQFGVDQLDQMSDCVETHGFAIVKDVLPKQMIDNLNALIHLRALLTDVFLIDEILNPRQPAGNSPQSG